MVQRIFWKRSALSSLPLPLLLLHLPLPIHRREIGGQPALERLQRHYEAREARGLEIWYGGVGHRGRQHAPDRDIEGDAKDRLPGSREVVQWFILLWERKGRKVTHVTETELARLSADVAQRVYGAKWYRSHLDDRYILSELSTEFLASCPAKYELSSPPNESDLLRAFIEPLYAQDLARAFALLEEVGKTNEFDLYRRFDKGFEVVIWRIDPHDSGKSNCVEENAQTFVVAICRAVLAAIEAGVWVPPCSKGVEI